MSASTFKTTPDARPDYMARYEAATRSGKRAPRVAGIIILGLLLFALSGLMLGFTVGLLNHHHQAPPPNPQTLATTKHTPTTTQTPTTNRVPLNCPLIDEPVYQGIASGEVSYTLSTHAVDKSGECAKSGKAIQQAGITFKLWLATIPENQRIEIPAHTWTHLENLNQPLPHEIENGLTFDTTTTQVQQSNAQGQSSWKFGVSPNVKAGKYYLVVLADWDGIYANWTWIYFEVQNARQ